MRLTSLTLLSLMLTGFLLVGCSSEESPSENGTASTTPEGTAETPASPSGGPTTPDAAPEIPDIPDTAGAVVAAENGLDLKYITEDFTSALILHPSRILGHPLISSLEEAGVPVSQGVDEMIQNSGIDPNTIAQVIVLGDKDSTEAASMMGPGFFGFGGGPGGFEDVGPPAEGPPDATPPSQEEIEELEDKPESLDQGAMTPQVENLQPVNFQPPATDGAFEEGDGPGPGGPKGPQPMPTVIVRFTESVDPETFFDEKPIPPLEDADVDGLSVKKIPSPNMDGVFYFADNKTLISTKSTLLKKMVDAKPAKSPLITELQQVDSSNDVILVIDMAPIRDLIVGLGAFLSMGGEQEPNPDLTLALKLAAELKTITITAGISSDSLLSLSVVGESAETIAQVNQKLDEQAQLGRGLYQQQKGRILEREVGLDDQGKELIMAMSDEVVAGISNKADGTRLTVSIPKPSKLTELPGALKPLIEQAQKAPIRMQKKNNLKMIGLAFHNYYSVHNGFPSAGSDHSGDIQGLSWRVHLLPYLDQGPLYDQFHLDEPWDSEHNASLIAKMPEVFKSPEVTEEGKTAFQVFVGKGAAFEGEAGLKFRDFTDGTSNTILTIETSPEKAEYWTKPGGIPFEGDQWIEYFKTPYEYGILFGRVDGSVQESKQLVDKLETFKALITRNGGEVIDDF